MRPVLRTVVPALAVALAVSGVRSAGAQTPNIRVAGRVQTQFYSVSADSTANWNPNTQASSGFEIRRLRIQADVRIGENVNMVLQPSFEMGVLRLRDAYLRVVLANTTTSGFGLTMGQEKKPFNRYNLTSSNNLPSIERGLRVPGLNTGHQAIAQYNVLEDNGYIEHDIGVSADVFGLANRLQFKIGVYNGSGESARDQNNAKSFAGRLSGTILQDAEARPVLRAGAAFISRDRAITPTAVALANPDSVKRTSAFAIDLEWGDFRPGFHVIADFATGTHLRAAPGLNLCLNGATPIPCRVDGVPRNYGNVRPNAPDSAFSTFASLQVVGAYRMQFDDPSGSRLIKIIEPALRVDYTDAGTSSASDHAMLITPVLNVYFSQTTIVRVGVDFYRYYDPSGVQHAPSTLRISWQANF